jgi:hypothetical protein
LLVSHLAASGPLSALSSPSLRATVSVGIASKLSCGVQTRRCTGRRHLDVTEFRYLPRLMGGRRA